MRPFSPFYLVAICCLLQLSPAQAQNKNAKYPSLLWEITGNGLKKPSYLFGTMHISNKLAFNLSDSFYHGIQSSDVVAIEINPDYMQSEMPAMNEQTQQYRQFYTNYYNNRIIQSTFTSKGFEGKLKYAIKQEPQLNNALLYRTVRGNDNFEENTYLDLYIYQTGRKLGKEFTGVENFWESERLSVEAMSDMRNEKKKKTRSRDYSSYDIGQGLQDAYRKGDLDALDSLNMLSEQSAAYLEKFLFRRNENMAVAMDSIMRTKSLFTGVGAAHLPGKRGVIELLRKKGYKLRPVYMKDRNANQKEIIDSMRVPVVFDRHYARDSFYSVKTPGPLFDMYDDDAEVNNYADMANGSYYLITRIKTRKLFSGMNEGRVLKVIDSMLYESIPGKILSKEAIQYKAYKGYDVVNRTRRGDVQHYQIYVTPYDILIFKMSGTENYVRGPEADSFFSSIKIRQPRTAEWKRFEPQQCGFSISMPATPKYYYNPKAEDGNVLMEYEAIDPESGDAYMLVKRMNYNFNYMDEDSFVVGLANESFYNNTTIKKQTSRKALRMDQHAAVDASATAENGDFIRTRFIVSGPEYYMLAVRSKTNKEFPEFFNSFKLRDYTPEKPKHYIDSLLHFEVNTSVQPELSEEVSKLLGYSYKYMRRDVQDDKYNSDPENLAANFVHPATGQTIVVSTRKYGEYYYNKDTLEYMKQQVINTMQDSDLVVTSNKVVKLADNTPAISLWLADTNTTQVIRKLIFLKGNMLYQVITQRDSLTPESSFERDFFASVQPYNQPGKPSIFEPKFASLFKNYYSKDTTVHKRAISAIASSYFGPKGYPYLLEALKNLKRTDPDYFDLKNRFIRELGYLYDSTVNKEVVKSLVSIYNSIGDTTVFQNTVLNALARLKTREATEQLKQLLLQDPPAFEDDNDYQTLLSHYKDTLELAVALYPELLQLSSIQGFKEPVVQLLSALKEKKLVAAASYEKYVAQLTFDAKIELKKQMQTDEKQLQDELSQDDNDYRGNYSSNNDDRGILYDYAVLLAPFYDQNPNVAAMFTKLLQTRNNDLRFSSALLLLEYRKPVPDSVWAQLAKNNEFRTTMYTRLKKEKKLDYFPARYKTQLAMAKGLVYAAIDGKVDSLKLLGKQPAQFKNTKGVVYVFKYKTRNSDDWKLALSGIQPEQPEAYSDNDDLVFIMKKPMDKTKPEAELINTEVRKAIVSRHNAGKNFYKDGRDYTSFLNSLVR